MIATGLVNPRGIAFAPDGALYVAEAGRGGNGTCIVLSDGQNSCYGQTGAIARIAPDGKRNVTRVIRSLPSLAAPDGFGAIGPQGVSFGPSGTAKIVIGLAANPAEREGLGARSALFGQLIRPRQFGIPAPALLPAAATASSASAVDKLAYADIAGFEADNDPVPGGVDSNPYGVLALGSRDVVADAGANALLQADAGGVVTALAVFEARQVPAPPFLGLPPGATIPMQAVPTSVAQGPDGWLYVGQLTGFPFPVGLANVYRVPPEGGMPEVFASGFTNIIGLAFDAHGRLHVLQIGNGLGAPDGPPLQTPGKLIRVNGDGSQTLIYDGLYFPGGLAIGPDGAAYVTNNGIVPGPVPGAFPDGGQVVRIGLE
ncbi:ScyD/ScyE family protein [Pseudoduganella lurida]|uniref:ScyD/ScyE family protein n=1 Tax=Pseudoduganella lurida TaxID=1036180 RepID=UPI0013158310|nr:ScyD/ScyE family protein [Pseudoduganella lurida]